MTMSQLLLGIEGCRLSCIDQTVSLAHSQFIAGRKQEVLYCKGLLCNFANGIRAQHDCSRMYWYLRVLPSQVALAKAPSRRCCVR